MQIDDLGPLTITLFGASGDLAQRKIFPALIRLFSLHQLPSDFRLFAVTRQALTIEDILLKQKELFDEETMARFTQQCEVLQMDFAQVSEFERLRERLTEIDQNRTSAQRIFFLSVPPETTQSIIVLLGKTKKEGGPRIKIMFEKPFGVNEKSAAELLEETSTYFDESEIYRVDHYLAKQMSQNIVLFRRAYGALEKYLSKDHVEYIEIKALEAIGIENRKNFYEQTGALRDLIQSHLLQLLAQSIAEAPEHRLPALMSLLPIKTDDFYTHVHRGQYRNYKEEVANDQSSVETFVDLTLFSDDPRWSEVPLTLTTGKALDKKETSITFAFKGPDYQGIIFRIDPDPRILVFGEIPEDLTESIEKMKEYMQSGTEDQKTNEGYAHIFMKVLRGERDIFISKDELLACWRIIDPIEQTWILGQEDLFVYDTGITLPDIRKSYEYN